MVKTLQEFIEKANIIHNNKYDYSKSVYKFSRECIIISCPIHMDFLQRPNGHLRGAGCKKCSNEKIKERMTIPWDVYKEQLNNIHNNKYDYSKVLWNGVDSNIIVICPTHGDFIIRPLDHKNGRECKLCSKQKKHFNTLSTQQFIETALGIWNGLYEYSKVNYINSYTKVIIICKKHGDFEQLPSNHYKYGCSKCAFENNIRNNQLKEKSKNEFEQKANLVHQNVYDYSKTNYINAVSKVTVICKNHGEFSITPNNHLRGKGCPPCGKEKYRLSKIKPFQEYYDDFIKLYNDRFDYSLVNWKGGTTRIIVICKKHGEFSVIPHAHRQGTECSKCRNNHSPISITWLEYMKIKYSVDISHAENIGEYIIPGSRYKADGYAKSINTIFEFHGDFWHGNPKIYNKSIINPRVGITYGELYENTVLKTEHIKKLGYNIIEIWENDWKIFIKYVKLIQTLWRNKRVSS